MRIIKIVVCVIVFYRASYGGTLLDEDIQKVPKGFLLSGFLECNVTQMVEICHSGADSGLPCKEKGMYVGPGVYDIGPDTSIYILYDWILHHFTKTGDLINKIHVPHNVCDFKLYDNEITVFQGTSLTRYFASTLELIGTQTLELNDFKPAPIGNLSYFYGRFLFLRAFDPIVNVRLRAIYNLASGSMLIVEDSNRATIPAAVDYCQNCDQDFLEGLFSTKSMTNYRGQSNKLLIYTYACSPITRSEICKKETLEYYVMDKSKNTVHRFNVNEQKIGRITLSTRRPFVFLNDTSAVLQTIINGKNNRPCVRYSILSFHRDIK